MNPYYFQIFSTIYTNCFYQIPIIDKNIAFKGNSGLIRLCVTIYACNKTTTTQLCRRICIGL